MNVLRIGGGFVATARVTWVWQQLLRRQVGRLQQDHGAIRRQAWQCILSAQPQRACGGILAHSLLAYPTTRAQDPEGHPRTSTSVASNCAHNGMGLVIGCLVLTALPRLALMNVSSKRLGIVYYPIVVVASAMPILTAGRHGCIPSSIAVAGQAQSHMTAGIRTGIFGVN